MYGMGYIEISFYGTPQMFNVELRSASNAARFDFGLRETRPGFHRQSQGLGMIWRSTVMPMKYCIRIDVYHYSMIVIYTCIYIYTHHHVGSILQIHITLYT